jgi:hypothetical protein
MKKLLLVLLLGTAQLCFGALPTITFNSSTGSDTQASGSGGTAVFGTGASTTAANNTVNLSADAPDLSGVATDGSATLWVNSSSGRKHSKITAVNDGTDVVTVQDNMANTESGRTWAIGGKRATLASTTQLGSDVYGGWTVVLEDDQTITAAYVLAPTASAADGPFILKGNSTTTRRVITQSSNTQTFSLTAAVDIALMNLQFKNSNATKTSASAFTASVTPRIRVSNCIFGDATSPMGHVVARTAGSPNFSFYDCEFKNLAVEFGGAVQNVGIKLVGCWVHNNTGDGVGASSQAYSEVTLVKNIINANGDDGVACTSAPFSIFTGNTIHGNTGDGVQTTSTAAYNNSLIFSNNITGNGGFGWNATASSDERVVLFDFNNYGSGSTANTSGAYNNITAGANDLLVDPGYVNAASNNFAIGKNVKNKAFPGITKFIGANQSGSIGYQAIGATGQNPDAFAAVINQ